MIQHLNAFAMGFGSPLHGMRLLIHRPALLRWAIIPFFIGLFVTVVSGIAGFTFLIGVLPNLMWDLVGLSPLSPEGSAYLILYWLTLIFAWPLAFVGVLYFSFLIAKLIAAPFFSFLAEKVIESVLPQPRKRFQVADWFKMTIRGGGISIVKLVVFGFLGALFFLLSIIPGFGLVTGAGVLFLFALDIADSAFDALELSWGERWEFIKTQLPFFSGLSLALGLAFLVPGLNFVLLPVAIAGVTDQMRELQRLRQ